MRFLLDENLSHLVAELIEAEGHEVVYVRDIGLMNTPDHVILERAASEHRTLISADTDFGRILTDSGAAVPSLILPRRESDRSAAGQASLILANLEQIAADLDAGAIAVLEAARIRVRRLPVIALN